MHVITCHSSPSLQMRMSLNILLRISAVEHKNPFYNTMQLCPVLNSFGEYCFFLCTWEVSSLLSRGKYAVEVFDKSIDFVFM